MNILFLCDDYEDYLADSVLHGLRQLDPLHVVDYPRKDCLYRGGRVCKDAPAFGVRGGGFSLYGLLEEPTAGLDRSQIWQRLESGWFDVVILSNVWRQWGLLLQWRSLFQRQPLILLDGDDDERLYPLSSRRLRQFGLGTGISSLLRSNNTHYFKRELTPVSFRWRPRFRLHPVSFSIPASCIDQSLTNKTQLFPRHIVDPDVAQCFGGSSGYAFTAEDAYRADLRSSRFSITTKRAGWDCLRHYELAASGTVLCFRDLTRKPDTCAPFGLRHGVNCLSYESVDDLRLQIEALTPESEQSLQHQSLAWARSKSTQKIANEILQTAGLI